MTRWLVLLALAACDPAPPASPEAPPPLEPPRPARSVAETMRRLGLEALCHAEPRSEAHTVGGEAKDARMREWLERQVADEGVRRLALEELPALAMTERIAELERISRAEKIERCPTLDLWRWRQEREAGGGLPCVEACTLRLGDTSLEARADCGLGCAPDGG